MNQTDVLVVGAGPTGLTTAIELVRRGINVRIIERRTQPSTLSKAFGVQARTLELMDILGVADELVRRGYTAPGIDFGGNAQHPLRANMYSLDTRFPFILILPQADTEAVLEQHLHQLGVTVERGKTLTHFVETETGVCSTISTDKGETLEIESSYIVGSDGSHSTVRQVLRLPFEGSSYWWSAFLGDVFMQGHDAEGGPEQHSNDRGLAFIVPFADGWYRIVTIDYQYQNEPRKDELSLEELQESISAILEKPIELSDPKWLTRWGAKLSLVSNYRVGRAFLAGDAAHTHSPAGGQGMNTGIQDAFNLGWKLAFVIQGIAPDSLLDTYHAERHAVGERVLRVSDFLLRSLLLRQAMLRHLREALFRLFMPLAPVQKKLAENLSGISIRYNTGNGELAGLRLPDIELMGGDHETVRLYELLRFPGYTLLLFIEPNQAQLARQQIDQITSQGDMMLNTHVILNSGLPKRHDFGVNTLVDYRGEFAIKIGAKTGHVILMRPDAYVAFSLAMLVSPDTFKEQQATLNVLTNIFFKGMIVNSQIYKDQFLKELKVNP